MTETTEKKEPQRKEGNGSGIVFFNFVIFALISVIITVSALILYDRYYAQKIVFVDIKAYMDEQKSQYMAKKLTDEQLSKNIDRIRTIVEKIPKNYIVLVNLPSLQQETGSLVVKSAVTVNLNQ